MKVYFGDLNFRIDMSREDIEEAATSKDYRKLRVADEFFTQGMMHEMLKTCQEGQLSFEPTYKYDVGTNDYDTSSKQRSAAWTDRVLFSQEVPSMTVGRYDRADVNISDHRPVYAHFKVKVNKIDDEARALVEENLIAKFNATMSN